MLNFVTYYLQLLSWIRKVGEETLNSQAILLRTATDAAGVKTIEKSFENFYFNALVSMIIFIKICSYTISLEAN